MQHALESVGAEVYFCLCPIRPIQSRYQEGVMEGSWGDHFFVLNSGRLGLGTSQQQILDKLKHLSERWSLTRRLHRVNDCMLADGYICKSLQQEFEHLVDRIRPDFVVAEYAILSKLVQNLPPSVVRVLDTHDRFADRNDRIRAAGGGGLWFSLTGSQEAKLLKRFDHVLAIQKHEGRLFETLLASSPSEVHVVDVLAGARRKRFHANNSHVMGFIGSNTKHNREGLRRFLDKHWINIRSQMPSVEFHVAGMVYEELVKWKQHGVSFLGRVGSLGDFYDDCCFMVNPCITGSGLKIKSLEAMEYGKPLVTTPEGVCGLEEAENRAIVSLPLDDEKYSQACVNLYADEAARRRMGDDALSIVNRMRETSITGLKDLIARKNL